MAEGKAAAANASAAKGMLTSGALGLGSALGISAAYNKKHGISKGTSEAMNLAAGGGLANAAANAGEGAAASPRKHGLMGMAGKVMRAGALVAGGVAGGHVLSKLHSKGSNWGHKKLNNLYNNTIGKARSMTSKGRSKNALHQQRFDEAQKLRNSKANLGGKRAKQNATLKAKLQKRKKTAKTSLNSKKYFSK